MSENLYIDVHALQVVPPSNINRDDTGSPKTAQYGGVTRARVSSQAWKRAIREYFVEKTDANNLGIRSREVVSFVASKIRELDSTIDLEESVKLSNNVFNNAGIKTSDNKVKALFFIGNVQAEELAKAAIEGETRKKELQNLFKANSSIDIALFGRMVADDPYLNEDATAQVAHAISTHAVQTEYDFFTGTDDLALEDNAGAGMLGTIEFNSSVLYRYANIAAHNLKNQLQDLDSVVESIKLFIEAFALSMPTGKSNTFANQTIPQTLILTIRRDRPVNLITGFEKPVTSRGGYLAESNTRLVSEFESTQKFVGVPVSVYSIGLDDFYNNNLSLFELLEEFSFEISKLLQD